MIILKNKNVVITGASSGIGRSTAILLAKSGANIIIAARREKLLQEVVDQCKRHGVKAFYLLVDVTKIDNVQALFEFALSHLGSIDIWINNAGVGSVGEFTKTPIEVHERVIQTNLLGYLYGAYVVIPYFKDKKQGILINNISLGAFIANPYAVAYSASKFAVRGYSEALRAELVDYPQIHVCDIYPSFVDTPGIEHAANFSGKKLRPAPPIFDPDKIAEIIVQVCESPKPTTLVGASGRVARLSHALMPNLFGKWLKRITSFNLRNAEKSKITQGNLFHQIFKGKRIHGGWKRLRSPPFP